jgi:hypothetical protein
VSPEDGVKRVEIYSGILSRNTGNGKVFDGSGM